MKFTQLVATTALVVGAMAVASGTAYAAPATPEPAINYSAEIVDRSVVTTIDAGVFEITDDQKSVAVVDQAGATLVTFPLSFNLGGLNLPYKENISGDGKTLTLFPQMDLSQAKPADAAVLRNNVASPAENTAAENDFVAQLGIATAAGGLTGTIIGGAIGCVATLEAGCLAGLVAGAGIGTVLGTITAGGPTLIIGGINLVNTLIAAPGTTVYAVK